MEEKNILYEWLRRIASLLVILIAELVYLFMEQVIPMEFLLFRYYLLVGAILF